MLRLGLTIHGVDLDDAVSLATMGATSGLRMPDVTSVHLALRLDAVLAMTDRSLGTAAQEVSVKVVHPMG